MRFLRILPQTQKKLENYFDAEKIHFNQKPQDKKDFIKQLQSKKHNILMTGDGLNDSGALMQSNVALSVADDVFLAHHLRAQGSGLLSVVGDRPHQVIGAETALLFVECEVLHVGDAERMADGRLLLQRLGQLLELDEKIAIERVVDFDTNDGRVQPTEGAIDLIEACDLGVVLRQEGEQIVILIDRQRTETADRSKQQRHHDYGPSGPLADQRLGEPPHPSDSMNDVHGNIAR